MTDSQTLTAISLYIITYLSKLCYQLINFCDHRIRNLIFTHGDAAKKICKKAIFINKYIVCSKTSFTTSTADKAVFISSPLFSAQ